MPHDSRGLVMIYGGAKEEQRKKKEMHERKSSIASNNSSNASMDEVNHFKRRSNSMQGFNNNKRSLARSVV